MKMRLTLFWISVLIDHHFRVGVDANDIAGLEEGAGPSCRNGGLLTEGSNSYVNIFPEDIVNKIPFLQITSKDNMYCECGNSTHNAGFTGIDCTIPYEICKDDSVCFHGAPCVQDFSNINKYHCACPLTTYPVDGSFVGKSCEYEVTSYCKQKITLIDDDFDEEVYDFSIGGEWYCANNGNCRDGISRPSEKCECTDEFYGLHCEFMEELVCELECFNGGVCKNGVKDYSSLSNSLQEYFSPDIMHNTHCICPYGFTGLQCEIDISSCGDNHCLNGGVCIDDTICDCTDASKTTQDDVVLKFSGNFCESQVSSFCPAPSGFDPLDFFCTNDGECAEDPWKACKCGADFGGPRCEFSVQNIKECDLQCQNGGTCFFGDAQLSSHPDIINDGKLELDTSPINNGDKMHCKCPDGFSGNFCDIEICGDYEHFCMNTGSCIQNNDSYTCECAANATDTVYAGVNCNYVATTFCEGPGAGLHSFCTNEGTCKSTVGEGEDHPGCECSDEFIGDFCEISTKDNKRDNKGYSKRPVLWYVLISIPSLLAYIVGTIFIIRRLRNSKDREHIPIDNPPEVYSTNIYSNNDNDNKMKMSEIYDIGTYKEFSDDSNEFVMQDVEIS